MSDATLDAFAARDQYKKERDDLRHQNEKLAKLLQPQILALKSERDQLRERLQRIKNELSGIDPADLTKAEKNILRHIASI